LKEELIILGDLDSYESRNGDRFDEELENAVRGFQRRHGLIPDGVVGRATLGDLNVSPEERISQIEVNMERWRWLPETMGDRYLSVCFLYRPYEAET
jgi:L,D-transpeptidase YcbB